MPLPQLIAINSLGAASTTIITIIIIIIFIIIIINGWENPLGP